MSATTNETTETKTDITPTQDFRYIAIKYVGKNTKTPGWFLRTENPVTGEIFDGDDFANTIEQKNAWLAKNESSQDEPIAAWDPQI